MDRDVSRKSLLAPTPVERYIALLSCLGKYPWCYICTRFPLSRTNTLTNTWLTIVCVFETSWSDIVHGAAWKVSAMECYDIEPTTIDIDFPCSISLSPTSPLTTAFACSAMLHACYSFVPAEYCRVGIVDRLLTRIHSRESVQNVKLDLRGINCWPSGQGRY